MHGIIFAQHCVANSLASTRTRNIFRHINDKISEEEKKASGIRKPARLSPPTNGKAKSL
jgi:hypothetical protein